MANYIPIHGNPNNKVFGVIGSSVETDEGYTYIKKTNDTMNNGWENLLLRVEETTTTTTAAPTTTTTSGPTTTTTGGPTTTTTTAAPTTTTTTAAPTTTTTSPPILITATGGNIYTSGDYKVHEFSSSANFVASYVGGSTVELMLVGCGGAGGWGGGGAGGYVYVPAYSLPGVGCLQSVVVGDVSVNSGNSVVFGYTADKGGAGGGASGGDGSSGGCGGGASKYAPSGFGTDHVGGTGTQGYSGGDATYGGNTGAGGGGVTSAGTTSATGDQTPPHAGGNPKLADILTPGNNTFGRGGDGWSTAVPGTPNTGNGGAGGALGGTGIVRIRYKFQ